MKKILLIFVAVIGFGIMANAQDVILKQDGSEIRAKVTEITDQQIKYKDFDFQSGPTRNINISEVFMITYENGKKEVFKKPFETKEVSTPEAAKVIATESAETVYIPDNQQNRKDVIVFRYGIGRQTKITDVDNKYIYYILYKHNGNEKNMKVKQKNVEFTLTFNEQSKQEKYSLQMEAQDFNSLPIYFPEGKRWAMCVFGTNSMTNLSHLQKVHTDIYKEYMKGKKQINTGGILGCFLFIIPVQLVGMGIQQSGINKVESSFRNYYSICVDLGVCAKYGIVVTPYNTSVSFKTVH